MSCWAVGCIHSVPKGHAAPKRTGAPRPGDNEIRDRIECSAAAVATTIGTTSIRYAYLSQRGYYPDGTCKCTRHQVRTIPCIRPSNGVSLPCVSLSSPLLHLKDLVFNAGLPLAMIVPGLCCCSPEQGESGLFPSVSQLHARSQPRAVLRVRRPRPRG